jgi:hypothetical protein
MTGACRYYIGYKLLKKKIKVYSGRAHASGVTDAERHEIVKSFSELLDSQVGLPLLAISCLKHGINGRGRDSGKKLNHRAG